MVKVRLKADIDAQKRIVAKRYEIGKDYPTDVPYEIAKDLYFNENHIYEVLWESDPPKQPDIKLPDIQLS